MFNLIFLVPFDHRKHIVIRADILYSTLSSLTLNIGFLFLMYKISAHVLGTFHEFFKTKKLYKT